jgi:hypothetical protein
MASKMENPARAARGVPVTQAGSSNYPEFTTSCVELQTRRLSRLYAISFETASVLAPLIFAVVPR